MYASVNYRSNILRPVVNSTNEFMTSCSSSVALKTMRVSAITKFWRQQQQACMYPLQLNFKANNVFEITEYQSQQQICVCNYCPSKPTSYMYVGYNWISKPPHMHLRQAKIKANKIRVCYNRVSWPTTDMSNWKPKLATIVPARAGYWGQLVKVGKSSPYNIPQRHRDGFIARWLDEGTMVNTALRPLYSRKRRGTRYTGPTEVRKVMQNLKGSFVKRMGSGILFFFIYLFFFFGTQALPLCSNKFV